jgi:formylglycine-generating enzyme required for sulfatase activity
VTIAGPFAVSRTEVTRGQFAAFIRETGHKIPDGCYAREGGRQLKTELSWQSPGFSQDDGHPVVCVSWEDANSYGEWLSRKTGNAYRLLSEPEFEYAARAGSATRFTFGDDERDLCGHGNSADQTAGAAFPTWSVAPCRDGYVFTAPVASFKPNKFGLYDMHGNVWEWIGDCQSESLAHLAQGAPAARPCPADAPHILRGGSWSDPPERLRSAARIAGPPRDRDQIVGFRVARDLQAAR